MNTPNKPFALSLTAQEVHEALLSVNNKIDKSNIAFNLLSPSNDTVPSTQAVLNALDVVSGDFSSLGALSQEDNIDLSTNKAVGILPISKGGTGSSTAVAARQALNVLTPDEIDERINNAIPEIQEVDLQGDKIINELPVSRGGTGASSVGQARLNLGVDSSVRVTEKITEETWGGYLAGYFEYGFRYTSSDQVARDSSNGKYYKYIGPSAFPVEVAAGTIASQNTSSYQEVKNIGYTIKDNEGFKQALLSEADITPNGLPDTQESSQSLDALLKITDYRIWGDRFVGTFENGFTYNRDTDVARGQDGKYYSYIGSASYPVVVATDTVASDFNSLYQIIEATNHNSLTNRDALDSHPASAISLAVKDALTKNPPSLQDTLDWAGVQVSDFIHETDSTISQAFQRAVDYCRNVPYKGTRVVFPKGSWKYDTTTHLGNLSDVVIDLNGCTLERRSASTFSTVTTSIIPAGVGLESRTFTVGDSSKFKVGDLVYAIKGVSLSEISLDAREIQSINGNTIVVAGAFFFNTGTPYGSPIPSGTTICKRVVLVEGSDSFSGLSNPRVHITNGTVEGNSAAQPSRAWVFNTEVLLISSAGSISKVHFKDVAGETIVGHGVDVHNCEFSDLQGSCMHLSVHDNGLGVTGGAWFRNNQCQRTNLATQAVSGHAEGLVTFSWGAGRLIVENNICRDGTEPFLGAFGSPTEDNPDKYLIVRGNILERFPTIMAYLSPTAEGVRLADNMLIDTGVLPQVQEAILNNPKTICSGNLSVGTTPFNKLQNIDRMERLAIGNDVVVQERQRLIVSDPDAHAGLNLVYTPNPINAQFVVQGYNTLTECAVRVNADYKRSLYTANGLAAGTFVEYWTDADKHLSYLINVPGGGGKYSWTTYNGGVRTQLVIDDEGVSLEGMQVGRATYYGDKEVDGCWRVILLGGDLVHQKRVEGEWVTKQTVSGQ